MLSGYSFIGELMGTATLIVLGDGVVAGVALKNSKSENAGWGVVATGWAFAVMVGVFVAGAFGSSQGDINPAVTLGKAFLAGDYQFVAPMITAQLIGAFIGAVVVWLAYLPHWKITENPATQLGVFSTGPAVRCPGCNLLTEIIGTIVLVLGVCCIFGIGTETGATIAGGLAPYLVGALVWSIGLSLGGPTGYAINPARDLGPRIAHAVLPIPGKGGSDWGYSWVPVIGPFIGAILAVLIYRMAL
ncbi:MAG: aquaporin family protein [Verrucomicrobiales bacterium]|jgi:glycerol uptake facilitator protein|nr:aquaporin family protein [Verrucomicrobiales bacterium]